MKRTAGNRRGGIQAFSYAEILCDHSPGSSSVGLRTGAVGGAAERTKSKKELAMDAAIAQAEAEAHAEASAYAAAHTYAPGTSAIHQWTFGENRGRSEVGALG